MKTIKVDHNTAERIRGATEPALGIVYDGRQLGVGDRVELVDKVNPQVTATWVSLGSAEIDTIVEKRLMRFNQAEFHTVFGVDDIEAAIAVLQKQYGPEIAPETPVKIMYLAALSTAQAIGQDSALPHVSEVKLYADGGSRGNPGPSASGYVIMDMDDVVLERKGVYLGVTTNNQAEYQALKLGLTAAHERHARVVHVYMDSMLVINQMKGIFKVKNRDLWPIHDSIKQRTAELREVTFTHVPRELNKQADKEVNDALDAALKRKRLHNAPEVV